MVSACQQSVEGGCIRRQNTGQYPRALNDLAVNRTKGTPMAERTSRYFRRRTGLDGAYRLSLRGLLGLLRVGAAAAVIAGWSATGALAQQDQLPTVTAAKPVVRDIVEDDEFVGRFQAVDEVTIRARVGGYLEDVHFKDGAIVNKGDLLFTIDQRPYQAAYDAAKSQVDVANSVLTFAKAQLD